MDRQRDEFLVGRQDRPLRLCLLPLHVPVELPSLGPGAELLDGDLLKVEPLLEVRAERFKVCGELGGGREWLEERLEKDHRDLIDS